MDRPLTLAEMIVKYPEHYDDEAYKEMFSERYPGLSYMDVRGVVEGFAVAVARHFGPQAADWMIKAAEAVNELPNEVTQDWGKVEVVNE